MADSIQMHGQEKLREFLAKVHAKVENPELLYRKLSVLLLDQTERRFDTSIGTDDKPWKQSWRAEVQGGKTLRNTGRLQDSIVSRIQGNRITIGTNVKYAALMHFGGTVKPKGKKFLKFKTPLGGWMFLRSVKIPARPFLGISVDDSQEILFEIEEYLHEVLTDAKH
ncbi:MULTISPECIES: phage virion morphogenesis protein [Acinetobacter]|uniref:Virion morphogenesis protein n=1 Tax=Acinetobacter piscicola TaxID=2006115 RepID=A0A7S6VXB3_9GAMM|nr:MULTISPECIES: phage virion morphogenesis protein [Acinetobacter]QOW46457.1 virion morphogenesis protein [Acinetobacter piscicola]